MAIDGIHIAAVSGWRAPLVVDGVAVRDRNKDDPLELQSRLDRETEGRDWLSLASPMLARGPAKNDSLLCVTFMSK
jgi:hypothetical protein